MANELASFLAHYGVKGMRWGVRKSQSTATVDLIKDSTGERRAITYNPGKLKISEDLKSFEGSRKEAQRVQAQIDKHGKDLNAHPDARAATSAKNKATVFGLDQVSNKEIQDFVTRANLEQQYAKLNTVQTKKGQKFVANILANTGNQVASEYAKKGAKALIKSVTK